MSIISQEFQKYKQLEQKDTYKLFSYFRSSCAWRVRIALEYKGIKYETIPVHLWKKEQFTSELQKLNPMLQVPVLVINNGEATLAQSIAILEYLEEKHPEIPLLPSDLVKRAQIRQICELIASGIQPLQNLSTLDRVSVDDDAKLLWAQFWIRKGLTALEKTLEMTAGKYSVGDMITLADCCLVPQVFNAYRFGVDVTSFPITIRIEKTLNLIPAFQKAHASNQPDCPPELYSKF